MSRMLFLAAAGLAAASAALAQGAPGEKPGPTPAVVRMDLDTARAFRAAMAKTFDDGQINMIQSVGHQQAVAATCPGFTVDKAKFESEMNLIYDDTKGQPRTLTEAGKRALENKAMLGLGMVLGAQLAIASQDEKQFCAAAARERAARKTSSLIWASAN